MLLREMTRCTVASALHQLNTVKVGVRVANSRFGVWVCGEGPAIANLRYGARALVFVNEYCGRAMYLWGEFEPRITSVLRAVLREGDTALDIGAHFGVVGLLSAKCVGPAGAVHLFEPQPLLASCLRTSLLMNGLANAAVHQCALSDKAGSAVMTILDPSNWGMTTLSAPKAEPAISSGTISVRTENAGEYVASLGCTNVACIKIDVEGHEAVILESMREWLAKVRPPVIVFECHLQDQEFHRQASVEILSGMGYECLCFDRRPFWRTRLYVPCEKRPAGGFDFVAVLWQGLDEDRRHALQAMVH